MNRKDLKILMHLKGVKISKVAQEHSFSTAYVYDVIKGARNSKKIQSHLSDRLGIPFPAIQEAWNNTDGESKPAPEIAAMQKRLQAQFAIGA